MKNFLLNSYRTNFVKIAGIVLLTIAVVFNTSAQRTIIGAGAVSSGTSSNIGPIYRSSATSAFDFSQHYYLYTAAELSAASIFPGTTIDTIWFFKDNALGTAVANTVSIWRIHMKNTSTVPSTTWSSSSYTTQSSGATMVYNNTSQVIPLTTGWIPLALSTPFIYTGGSLEIGSYWDCSLFAGSPTTGGFSWAQDNITNQTFGGSSNVVGITMTSQTRRPRIQISYTPPAPVAPIVSTGSSSLITLNQATLSGSVTAVFPAITASGIVVGTSLNPTLGGPGVIDSSNIPVVTNGTFTKTFTGLTNATTYYYRTYATNTVGTTYGADSSFTTNATSVVPTVLRTAATGITGFAATVGGNITSNGGDPVIASGIVYSTSPNPTLATGIDSTNTPVVTSGLYTKAIGGLAHSTKYYYRAYATNAVGTGYSVQDSFTTELVVTSLPYFESFDSTTTPWTAAAINARTNSWVRGTPAKTNLNGAFSAPNAFVTTLTGNYLGTEDCVILSPQMDFSSLTAAPILRFKHEMDVDADLGYDGGVVEISINGGVWTRLDATAGTAPSYNTANSTAWYNNTSGFGTLGSPIWSVNTTTTYPGHVNGWITSSTPLTGAAGQSNVRVRFRFWADGVVDEGWAIDNIEIFEPTAPAVLTGTKTNITTSSVTLGGNITSNGGNAVTASGVIVSLSPLATRATALIDSSSNPLVGNGTFSVNIAGLANATTYYYRAYAVNSLGTSYGPDSSFTTNAAAVIPTVLGTAATGITGFAATVGGNITSDGGNAVTVSGIVYSTSPNPTLGSGVDSTNTPVVTLGSFTKAIGGLTHSTKYYYRAYATNAVGTAYSAQDSFTTELVVTSLPYFESFDSTTTPWTTAAINGGTNSWVRGTPAKTNLNGAFSAPNAFVTTLTGSYLGSEDCVILSPQMDFSSLTVAPILRFKHEMDVDSDLGYDGGVVEISINGGVWTRLDATAGTAPSYNTANSTAWYNNTSGFGTLGSPIWSANTTTTYPGHVNGWITSSTPLTGAAGQSNVRVRFRFWADGVVDEGWAIDNIEVFAPTAPTVLTGTKINITTTGATLSGNITNNGGNAVTASGVIVSLSPLATRATALIDSSSNPLVGNGTFSVNIAGLTNATTYYYRAYAVNSLGTSYGPDSSFTTNAAAVIPTILGTAATGITGFAATVGGNITSDGGSVVTASGIVYSTSPNPTLGSGVDSTNTPVVTLGSFTKAIGGLIHSTKYYYRAYATNAVGTAYSAQDSFTTQIVVTSLPYNQNFDLPGNTGWTTESVNARYNSWALGTPTKTFMNGAYSAPNAYVTNLTGNYGGFGNEEGALVSPQFDFSASTSDPILRFRNKHKTDNDPDWDCGIIEISINNGPWTRPDNSTGTGTNFNTLGSHAWYNLTGFSGYINTGSKFTNTTASYDSQVNGWVQSATRLTGAAGQSNVRIRFHFAADQFGTDEGWAIDDIEVVQLTQPTPAVSVALTPNPAGGAMNVVVTPGNGQERLIVARLATTPSVAPFDTLMYTANSVFGSGSTTGTDNFVVYKGSGNSVNVTGLTNFTNYAFDVYEYNGKYMHNRFSAATTNSNSTLPVKLISFNGLNKYNDAVLNWATVSEIENKGFEVERSLDGKSFVNVGFVKGKGNSNSTNRYELTDKGVFAKNTVAYYRLKQIDFNGTFTYSQVIKINTKSDATNSMVVYPNPSAGEFNVSYQSSNEGNGVIEISDIQGKVVYAKDVLVSIGTNNFPIEEKANFGKGIYFVKFNMNGEIHVEKLVKN